MKTVAKNKATDGLVTQLKGIGATVSASYGRMVSALVPISALVKLDALSNLNFATPAYTPQTSAGLTDDQGAAAITSDSGSKKFGVDGTGVTVGVMSDSFNSLGGAAAGVASGDLPTVNVLKEDPSAGSDEGRGMAELVHDIAPGAGIAFYTAFAGEADFAAGILKLAQPTASGGGGAKVITDDVFYFDEPIYQEGIVAQAVNTAANTYGVSYFSSAGNQARQAYESAFNAVSTTVPAISASAGVYHDFDTSAGTDFYQPVSIAAGATFTITYQWDQPYASAGGAGSASTMGAYLIDPTKTSVVASATNNTIGGDPTQVLSFQNTSTTTNTYYLTLKDIAGATPGAMKYISLNGGTVTNYLTNTGASFGHNQATNAVGVAAAYYAQTPAYKVSPPLKESFSSAGGTPILFSNSGVRLASPDVRQQPAITSIDGTATTFFGGIGNDNQHHFYGTSAAAPHAAAVAALLLQAKPSLTNTQVISTLKSTATDMNTAGYDFDTGFGLIQAEAALRSVAGASVSGNVFRDYNNDGIKNGADVPLAGRTLFFDDNLSGATNTGSGTFASTDVPKAVPDGGATAGNPSRVTSNATVSGLPGRVTKVTVSVNISHTWASDLGLTLLTPSGLRIPLFTNIGGASGHGTGYNLTLDDASANYIQNFVSAAVLTGTYAPQSALSAANGENPNGTWKLEARDYWSGDVGTINSWSIGLSTAEGSTTSDASGNFSFTGLSPSSVYGTYNLRSDAPVGLTQTSPASPYNLTLTTGQVSTGRNFGFFAALPTISTIVLGNGTAQRSNVTSIDVTVTGTAAAAAGAFSLVQNSGPVIQAYTVGVTTTLLSGGTSTLFHLTFSGPGVTHGSVADGRYTLSIDGSKITGSNGDKLDAAGTATPGSIRSYLFFRLNGDADGNAVVNFNDFLVLQNSFNQSSASPTYNVGADNDLNGVVDFNDFLVLQNQFNHTV